MNGEDTALSVAKLTDLLTEETSCLRRLMFHEIAKFGEKKRQLVSTIQRSARDGSLRTVPNLRQALARLKAAIDANTMALDHAMRVQRLVFGVIAEAARGSTPIHSYGRHGHARSPARTGPMITAARF